MFEQIDHSYETCDQSPFALAGDSCTCAAKPQDDTRLYRWLMLSLLLHSLLSFLFVLHQENKVREEASIIFAQPDQQNGQTQMMPMAEPLPMPPQQQPTPTDPEEVQFNINLNQDSKFGAPELMADQYTPQATTESDAENEAQQPDAQESSHGTKTEEPSHSASESAQEQTNETVESVSLSPTSLLSDEKEVVAAKPKDESADQQKNPFEGSRKSAGPVSKQLSLAKLTEGFLDFVKERGPQESVPLQSNDVKYASYFQKVGWFLQNSFHLHNRPITLDYNVREMIDLNMVIDKSGKLVSCTIRQPCSAPAINNLLRKIVESAAPFPPLPVHLKKDRLSVNIPIHIDAHPGTHTYHFTFRG